MGFHFLEKKVHPRKKKVSLMSKYRNEVANSRELLISVESTHKFTKKRLWQGVSDSSILQFLKLTFDIIFFKVL